MKQKASQPGAGGSGEEKGGAGSPRGARASERGAQAALTLRARAPAESKTTLAASQSSGRSAARRARTWRGARKTQGQGYRISGARGVGSGRRPHEAAARANALIHVHHAFVHAAQVRQADLLVPGQRIGCRPGHGAR